ncbi:phosphoglycerate kinase [Bacteroidota bacterium]|nr:phosphoglycerate kinase [Bacteroidota bacterium]
MTTIDNFNFSGKKAIIRVDFNVPLDKKTFEVTDDTRIKAALKTINKILSDGGSVILMSHLGRPKTGPEEKYSLKHIVAHTSKLLEREVKFVNDCIGKEVKQVASNLKPGKVLLLENLRFHPEEEKGDENFAKELASLADVYVNDAFGTAHRAHASTTIVANYFSKENKMFGYLMASEIASADKVMKNTQHPFTAIIGGAKVSDKILILEKLVDIADNIIVGGGMSYTFYKAMGGNIGNSLCEDDRIENAIKLLEKAKQKNVKFLLPPDSMTSDFFGNDGNKKTADSKNIETGFMGLDIGPKAIEEFTQTIMNSKTILWNGPMGVFEMSNFRNGTVKIAEAVANSTQQGAYSLVGGGDSVAAVNQFGFADKVSYVSTGGGALLEYFEGKELPGVKAIRD